MIKWKRIWEKQTGKKYQYISVGEYKGHKVKVFGGHMVYPKRITSWADYYIVGVAQPYNSELLLRMAIDDMEVKDENTGSL